MPARKSPERPAVFSALLLALSLSACGPGQPPVADAPLYGSALTGEFDLVDKHGNQVRNTDFAGRYQLVYFGYAYCPDVCPFDVQRMMQGYNQFAAAHPDLADDVQPIFITVDPERDTPERVGQYAAAFSDKLLGLTGTPAQIEAAAAAFFAHYQKMEPLADGNYLMDHSRAGYLVDREGMPMALIPVEETPEAVAAELERWVR
ncbi:MAG: SCO family protein [Erythrobacter sp.]|nr:SCO family protein [Erythrobacter sp.]